MIQLIVACSSDFGIGLLGGLPWHDPEELKIFREKTAGSVLIVGRKTAETLPLLKGRQVIYVSRRSEEIKDANCAAKCDDLFMAIDFAKSTGKPIFIAGGAEIYQEALKRKLVDRMHISIFKTKFA